MSSHHDKESGDRRVGDYNRPRRPNADTIAYLRSLPLDVKASEDEVSHFLAAKEQNEPCEYPQSLAAALSAIDEIRNEIASLAGDEYGSQSIEILARIAAPYSEVAARTLLYGLATYHLHLASHRYGSHVVQTILELSVSFNTKEDLSLHDEAPQLSQSMDQLPSLSELILGMVEELSPFASQLAVHVCGSHVLRTLLCVMGDVQLVSGTMGKPGGDSMRRGRIKSKKKKKRKPDASKEPPHAGMMTMVYRTQSRLVLDSSIEDALSSLTVALCGDSSPADGPGELQQMACHPSAGPLLIVLLRVLTYSTSSNKQIWQKQQSDENKNIVDHCLGILKPEPTFDTGSSAHQLVQRLLCFQPGESEQPYAGDIIFGLSGEPRGSHVLETLLRVSSEEMYASILKYGDFLSQGSLHAYVEHDVSNFVVQTLLSTLRSKNDAEIMWKAIEKLISNGYVLDPRNKRRGILWRVVEMSAKHGVCQESILKTIRLGMGIMEKPHDEAVPDTKGTEDGKKKKKRQKASSISMQECVPRLLNLKLPTTDGERLVLDAAGTRTLHHLLRFTPQLCGDVLDGIIDNLSCDELESIARDGLGSRCIMDGILDGPAAEPAFAKANKSLLEKLSGRWVSLSVDRIGHHAVKKIFRVLAEMEDKAQLTAELAQSSNRLGGNAMGQSVIEACAVNEFLEGEAAWKAAVRKMRQREEWVQDIVDSSHQEVAVAAEGKKKRKRKKHSKKDAKGDDEGLKKQRGSSNVEAIMSTLSAGVQKSHS